MAFTAAFQITIYSLCPILPFEHIHTQLTSQTNLNSSYIVPSSSSSNNSISSAVQYIHTQQSCVHQSVSLKRHVQFPLASSLLLISRMHNSTYNCIIISSCQSSKYKIRSTASNQHAIQLLYDYHNPFLKNNFSVFCCQSMNLTLGASLNPHAVHSTYICTYNRISTKS